MTREAHVQEVRRDQYHTWAQLCCSHIADKGIFPMPQSLNSWTGWARSQPVGSLGHSTLWLPRSSAAKRGPPRSPGWSKRDAAISVQIAALRLRAPPGKGRVSVSLWRLLMDTESPGPFSWSTVATQLQRPVVPAPRLHPTLQGLKPHDSQLDSARFSIQNEN